MAFGPETIAAFGGAANDLFSAPATAKGMRLKAQGDLVEGENYDKAATLARQNEQFTEQSTAVKDMMSARQIQQGIGTETADIAGAGFARSGSALDLLRDSAQQGAIQHQLITQQGLITEAGYNEQASAYSNLANFARYSASVQNEQADSAETAGFISAGFKAATAMATLFTPKKPGEANLFDLFTTDTHDGPIKSPF